MSEENTPTREEQNQVFQSQPQPQQQLNRVSEQSGFDIPVESIALPSKGLIYSLDHPLANEESVEIRCMTAREEDLLTSRSLLKKGMVMTKLLEACLMNKTIEPDTMLSGDRNAILIAIRITGYGPEYTARISCPDCGDEHDHEFVMNNLEVKPLGARPLQPNVNMFSFTLPTSGAEVQFKLLTGRDEAELTKIAERNKKLKIQVSNNITTRLLHSILSINGESDKQKIDYAIKHMRAADSRALRNYIDEIEPDIKLKQWATCDSCGEESEVEIPLGISFFWPDLG